MNKKDRDNILKEGENEPLHEDKEEGPNLLEITMSALIAAKKAFEAYLEDLGHDPAYWDIKWTVWLLDASLTNRLTKIEIEHEIKKEEK